jgi:CMP-N,N'-diacetyllegionaminic acid synthase
MNLLITICARGGSKGIPGKNIKLLNGKPLIEYTINTAFEFSKKYNSNIALSTDDENILNICNSLNLKTSYRRPIELSTDNAGKIDTIYDILLFDEIEKKITYDYVLDLDVTSPLRTQIDLDEAFEKLQSDKNALNIFSVNLANKNPYFNMVEENKLGYFELSKKGEFLSRQTATRVFELNASFYFYRRAFFNSENRKVINDKSLIYLINHICFDLDHPIDFEFMNYLMENNKLDFTI